MRPVPLAGSGKPVSPNPSTNRCKTATPDVAPREASRSGPTRLDLASRKTPASHLRFHVRMALLEHLAGIVSLVLLLAEEEHCILHRHVVSKAVLAMLADPEKGTIFVAINGEDEVIGYLTLAGREWSDWSGGHYIWHTGTYLLPAFRGRRVFSALYEAAKEFASTQPDVCGLRCYIKQDNDRSIAVHRSVGMYPSNPPYLVFEDLIGVIRAGTKGVANA